MVSLEAAARGSCLRPPPNLSSWSFAILPANTKPVIGVDVIVTGWGTS
ncbi:MAG: hypothetical protein NTV14_07440 [Coprothermobacterota bacterium]|nr:hypothetical protein [Coprothermobacterota bacterium]